MPMIHVARHWIWCVASLFAAAGCCAAADLDAQREAFRAALAAATQPPTDASRRWAALLQLDHYPLYPYVELAALRGTLKSRTRAEIDAFLDRFPDTLPASDLRKVWLRELARRGDWKTFTALYVASSDADLQCDALRARIDAGSKLDYARDLERLWTSPRELPAACDAILIQAQAQGALDAPHIWQRLDAGAEAGNVAIVTGAAALLRGSARSEAERIASALRDPAAALAKAKSWADSPRTRDAVAWGLARYARSNSAAAETLWTDLQGRFKWGPGGSAAGGTARLGAAPGPFRCLPLVKHLATAGAPSSIDAAPHALRAGGAVGSTRIGPTPRRCATMPGCSDRLPVPCLPCSCIAPVPTRRARGTSPKCSWPRNWPPACRCCPRCCRSTAGTVRCSTIVNTCC